jgi:DNA-binding MurR/RpiR family transcriptional regulator
MTASRSPSRPSALSPVADEPIEARIVKAFPSLTPAHRQMAEFVRANLFQAATMRIDEFADATGVSIATANRFARALGFDGYPQFRTNLLRGFEATLAPVERLRSALESPASSDEVLASALELDIQNIDATRRALDAETCERAVTALLEARRVRIVGYGASAYLAGLMEHALYPYCRDVQSVALVGGASHAARRLFDMSADDVLVAIAFPRYVRDTIVLATRAREHGARVFALTDGPTSPLAPIADIAVYVRAHRRLSANSNATVLSVIEALCDAVAHRAPKSVRSATEMMEFMLPWLLQTSGK